MELIRTGCSPNLVCYFTITLETILYCSGARVRNLFSKKSERAARRRPIMKVLLYTRE